MIIEVITHCYTKKVEQYAKLLSYQLSSFALFPPSGCKIRSTICADKDDRLTIETVEWFQKNTSVDINLRRFSNPLMSKRSIGRNIAAKDSKADIVWFADSDYVHRGSLEVLSKIQWEPDAVLMFPAVVMINTFHKIGDQYIREMNTPRVLDIKPRDFKEKFEKRPIGGTQIVQGDFAREFGYLGVPEYSDYQIPTEEPWVMASTPCDVKYRKFCMSKGSIQKVELPEVYRLRHTESGIRPRSELRRLSKKMRQEKNRES